MSDDLTITVDTAALFKALDLLGEDAEAIVKAAAAVTAERVRAGAVSLLLNQTHGTGKTASAITVEEGDLPLGGYRVFVDHVPGRPANLPIWLEFGTVKMSARPFMRPAEAMEQGPHLIRVSDAVQRAIAKAGLA